MFPKPRPKPKQRTKRRDQSKLYTELVKPAYLRGLARGQGRGAARCELCLKRKATQIHHKRGRVGADLLDTRYFMGICDPCHRHVHENPAWAYEQGHLVRLGLADGGEQPTEQPDDGA